MPDSIFFTDDISLTQQNSRLRHTLGILFVRTDTFFRTAGEMKEGTIS